MRLITENGRVTGVECRSLRGAPLWVRAAHRLTHRAALKPYLYVPKLGRVMHRPADWLEHRYGRTAPVGAGRGVVIAAGGFGANRPMLRAHAPSARGGLPLATPGDDGSGIRLGTGAGGAAACLDRVSVWRFLTPPPALVRGLLVGPDGKRICDESRYGAAIGDAIVRDGGRAWLLVDRATSRRARRRCAPPHSGSSGCRPGTCSSSPRSPQPPSPGSRPASASTPTGSRPRWPPTTERPSANGGGAVTGDGASRWRSDPMGKPPDLLVPLDQPPYALIDFSIRPRMLTRPRC